MPGFCRSWTLRTCRGAAAARPAILPVRYEACACCCCSSCSWCCWISLLQYAVPCLCTAECGNEIVVAFRKLTMSCKRVHMSIIPLSIRICSCMTAACARGRFLEAHLCTGHSARHASEACLCSAFRPPAAIGLLRVWSSAAWLKGSSTSSPTVSKGNSPCCQRGQASPQLLRERADCLLTCSSYRCAVTSEHVVT